MSDSEKQPEGEVETTERPATSGKKVIGKCFVENENYIRR